MASKDVELKIVMENVPIGAMDNEMAREIQVMLQAQYADGVKVTVTIPEKPKKADKAA